MTANLVVPDSAAHDSLRPVRLLAAAAPLHRRPRAAWSSVRVDGVGTGQSVVLPGVFARGSHDKSLSRRQQRRLPPWQMSVRQLPGRCARDLQRAGPPRSGRQHRPPRPARGAARDASGPADAQGQRAAGGCACVCERPFPGPCPGWCRVPATPPARRRECRLSAPTSTWSRGSPGGGGARAGARCATAVGRASRSARCSHGVPVVGTAPGCETLEVVVGT